MLPLNVRDQIRGFSLIEQLVIITLIGVLAVIAIPSFLGVLDLFRVDQAVVDVRGALQETQRQAIRLSQACDVTLNLPGKKVQGPCLVTGDRTLPEQLGMISNIKNNPATGIQLTFGVLGTAEFLVDNAENQDDSSGKIVFYLPQAPTKIQKCIAISNSLGLTRVGVYRGSLTNSQNVSAGTCTASQ
jgi:type II secretory pathway pseudopilin PulG